MSKENKNPIAAALLNFVLPGLGYVYTGKRMGFGIGLILSSIILYSGFSLADIPMIVWIDAFVLDILFAYDGYKTAEEVNKTK